jgi:LPS sulfotransferase NodH
LLVSRPARAYLVCATPRSGSTLLCEALARTGVAGRPAEYFEALAHSNRRRAPREYFDELPDPSIGGLLADEPADPGPALPDGPYDDYFRYVLDQGTTPNGVFAAKLMWGYLEDTVSRLRRLPGVEGDKPAEVLGPGIEGDQPTEVLGAAFGRPRYVAVVRRDTLRQAISLWRAVQSSSWRADEGGGGPEPVFSARAIAHLRDQLATQEGAWSGFFARAAITPLTLIYEDYANDLEGAVREVLAHVGVEAPADLDVAVPLRRQADALTDDWVERFTREAA